VRRLGVRHRRPTTSDSAGFLQCFVSALLVDRLETACRDANTHKFLQLRHPNSLALQIGRENARHHFRDMPAYTTFLFGQTAPVNHAAPHCSGSCYMTNFHVAKKPRNLPCSSVEVKPIIAQRSLRSSAQAGRLGDPPLVQSSVDVERAITGNGQT
jgi:hypothetical protein